VQHAGVVHGLHDGKAGHAFKLASAWDRGYLGLASVTRNCSAVTAACLLTPRRLFLESGGFDEGSFRVAYNDVDYCHRLRDRGYRCVYAAGAELVHHEGASRGFQADPREEAALRGRYGHRRDPYFSPHLSLDNERFEIQPRRLAPPPFRRVRLLLATFNLNLEGSGYIQAELALALKREGVADPLVVSPQDGPLRRLYEENGIPVEVAAHPLAAVSDLGLYHRAVEGFARFLRGRGTEAVLANTIHTFYAVDAAARAGLPSLWNIHESEPPESQLQHFGPAIAAQGLSCLRFPYRVIFGSHATRAVYEALNSRHNFAVAHNPLDPARQDQRSSRWTREAARRALGLPGDAFAFLTVGTVCERKGQVDLPRALAHLEARWREGVHVHLVGDRDLPYSSEVRAAVRDLPEPLRDRCRLVRETEDTALYYRAADAFVCTSRLECFPRVNLEAMAYGLPLVTTPVFGVREQVREGVNGLFYTPGQAEELARVLESLLEDEGLRRRLAEGASSVLAALSTFAETAGRYAEWVREACAAGGAPLADTAARPRGAGPDLARGRAAGVNWLTRSRRSRLTMSTPPGTQG
jgi:glycosyltransferase involved in cell wall biosynthesis